MQGWELVVYEAGAGVALLWEAGGCFEWFLDGGSCDL